MKKILFITLPLLFSIGFSQKKNINEPNLMKGVKTQTKFEYEYEEIFGKPNWYPKNTTISKYNPNGNIFEQTEYGEGNFRDFRMNFSLKYLYKYNSKGNIIEESIYFADGSLLKKYVTKYHSNEDLVEQIHYNSDGEMARDWERGFAKCIYKYDSKGNMVERAAYESDGSLESKSIYIYDLKGNEVERAVYIDGSLKSKDISTFNTENRISEKTTYNLEVKFGEVQQTPMMKTNYEYDLY